MLENGFVKIYRSLLKWEWYDDLPTRVLFIHLLLTANYEDKEWHGITVKRGSRVSSWQILSRETKLSIQQCRTAAHNLESTGELTRSKYAKYTVFSIVNYNKFQEVNKVNNKKTTSNQQATQHSVNKQSTGFQQQCKKDKESKRKQEERNNIRAREENSSDADTGRQFELPPGQLGGVYHINEGNDF